MVRLLDKADSYKIKPKQTVDCVIIGYVEGKVGNAIGVTSLLGALNYPHKGNGQEIVLQSFIRVGAGISNELRIHLLDQLKVLKVEKPIPITDSEGRPVWFVKPKLIIEIIDDDIVAADYAKKPYRTQAFSWNSKKTEYAYIGVSECPKLLFPAFSKVRDDKDFDSKGARIKQVLDKAKQSVKKKGRSKKA